MKIKICGITNLGDATECQTLGVNYLGFIFYELVENLNALNILTIFTTIFFGLLLYFSDSLSKENRLSLIHI